MGVTISALFFFLLPDAFTGCNKSSRSYLESNGIRRCCQCLWFDLSRRLCRSQFRKVVRNRPQYNWAATRTRNPRRDIQYHHLLSDWIPRRIWKWLDRQYAELSKSWWNWLVGLEVCTVFPHKWELRVPICLKFHIGAVQNLEMRIIEWLVKIRIVKNLTGSALDRSIFFGGNFKNDEIDQRNSKNT